MNDEKKEGRPTPEQIMEWKQKHKQVHSIEIDEFMAILRKPMVLDLERAMAAGNKPKAKGMDFNRSILANCTLYKDPGFEEDDDRVLALLSAVGEIAAIREAEVKKL